MFRPLEDIYKEKEDKEKIAQLSSNKKLKYLAIGTGVVTIAILIVILACYDILSLVMMLVLRGCVGLCAIIFVIIIAIYCYRLNVTYSNEKYKSDK